MDFELTEEQAALREVSRSVLTASCPSELLRALSSAGRDTDDKLWQRGTELGWTGLAVPEEHDGAGAGLVELALVAEELGRAAAPGAFLDTALAASVLARHGRPELAAGLAEGELKASWARHGTARADGPALDGTVLSGRATAVQAAGSADWLLVTAGDRLFLVDQARAAVVPRRTLDETRRWYDVVLDDLQAGPDDVVTADPAEVRWLTDAGAVLTAADSLGVGERLLELTVAYVKVREQFGRPLGSFQSVKHKVADMLTMLKGARAATYYAAMALDARVADATAAASVAKAFTTAGVAELAGEALQAHGGIGFTWEHDLHLYLRRAKVNELLDGSAAEHYERLAALLD